jgi:hypothetical protein
MENYGRIFHLVSSSFIVFAVKIAVKTAATLLSKLIAPEAMLNFSEKSAQRQTVKVHSRTEIFTEHFKSGIPIKNKNIGMVQAPPRLKTPYGVFVLH